MSRGEAELLAHPFDRYQRLRAVADLLEAYRVRLGRDSLRLLDVGGLDGHLGLFVPWARTMVVDPGSEPGVSVRGLGQELPFADASVDAVACIDTLEHVPAPSRAAVIAELCRVSAGPVVVAAPFATPGVAAAERFVSDCHRALTGGEHRWLAEHAACGLPDLEGTRAELLKHRPRVHVAANGHLDSWRLMMAVNGLLDALPESHPIQVAVNSVANQRMRWAQAPSYRHLLVACRDDDAWAAALTAPAPPAGLEEIEGIAVLALGAIGRGLGEALAKKIAYAREVDGYVRRVEAERETMKHERAAFASETARARDHLERVESELTATRNELGDKRRHLVEVEGYARHVETEFGNAVAALETAQATRVELEARVADLERSLDSRNAELEKLSSHIVVRTLKRVRRSEL